MLSIFDQHFPNFLARHTILWLVAIMLVSTTSAQDATVCRSTSDGFAYEGECLVSPPLAITSRDGEFEHEINPPIGRLELLDNGGYRWRIDEINGPAHVVVTIRWETADVPGVIELLPIHFLNRPPTAEFFGPTEPVEPDTEVIIGFTNTYDLSAMDRASPFYYAYDCDGDGHREVDYTPNLTQTTCTYTHRDAPYIATGYVMDIDGGESTYTLPISTNPPATFDVCTDPDPARDLTGVLSGDNRSGTVTNSSDTCSYTIGMASYLMFDDIIDNQQIYDSVSAELQPGESLTLNVNLPSCATQVDLFHGEVLVSLEGMRYGTRLMDAVHTGEPYCIRGIDDVDLIEDDTGTSEALNAPMGQPNCRISDHRINNDQMRDCSPPVVVYCAAGNVEIWKVNPVTAEGSLWLSVTSHQIESAGIPDEEHRLISEHGDVLLYRLTTGELQVNTWIPAPYGSEPYVVTWDGC